MKAKNLKKSLPICILIFVTVFPTLVIPTLAAGEQNSGEIVAVTILSSVDKLRPGVEERIALEISIAAPFHINSAQPVDENMIPTVIRLAGPEGVTFGALQFPAAQSKSLSFSATPLEVYEGSLRVFTTVRLPPGFKEKELPLAGRIEYQACDDKACLPPADLEFRQVFLVAAQGETVTGINAPVFALAPVVESAAEAARTEQEQARSEPPPSESSAAQEAGEPAAPAEGAFTSIVEERGMFLTFLLIFLGGLGLNLTPCVYPLIPITIGYFGGQARGKKGGVFTHAIFYVLGMAVTYSALGVVAALTGSLFGGVMQNPVVLIVVAAVMVALALSMFDLYEFRLPSFLTRLAGGSQKGYLGTLLMGLTVGIVAAPCIGPFVLGLLTYVGGRGDALLGFLMFFVLALGLGMPFLFLAVFSGSIDRLPRSGVWMVWVRTIFGFVLLGMGVYFLEPLFPTTLAYHLTLALILLIGGIYMAWIEPTKIGGKVFPVIRQVVGILFFAAALIVALEGIQGYVQERVGEAVSLGEPGTLGPEAGIRWSAYSEANVEQAAGQSKPVLIDFHADWCVPCKELDKLTFPQPEVVEMARKFVMLKVDLTSSRNPETGRLKKKYQIKGVPTLVLLRADGSEAADLRIVGFVKKEKLLAHMERALSPAQ
jgi:thiol:disulfide interchange protein DsbD